MNGRFQFDIATLLVCTALVAVLLASWQIGGHPGMCLASLPLAVIMFAISIARSNRPLFLVAIALLLFYLFAGLVTVAPQ